MRLRNGLRATFDKQTSGGCDTRPNIQITKLDPTLRSPNAMISRRSQRAARSSAHAHDTAPVARAPRIRHGPEWPNASIRCHGEVVRVAARVAGTVAVELHD